MGHKISAHPMPSMLTSNLPNKCHAHYGRTTLKTFHVWCNHKGEGKIDHLLICFVWGGGAAPPRAAARGGGGGGGGLKNSPPVTRRWGRGEEEEGVSV